MNDTVAVEKLFDLDKYWSIDLDIYSLTLTCQALQMIYILLCWYLTFFKKHHTDICTDQIFFNIITVYNTNSINI